MEALGIRYAEYRTRTSPRSYRVHNRNSTKGGNRRAGRPPIRLLPLLIIITSAVARGATAGPASPAGDHAETTTPPWYCDGYVDFRYRLQATGGERDSDLDELFSLSFGDTGSRWVSGYVSARFSQDVDGFSDPDPFASLPDSHDRSYERLSAAYVDVTPRWRLLRTVRLGRQWLAEIPEIVRMDGARLETGWLDPYMATRVVLFGGLPDHPHESSRRNDSVLGGGLELAPFETTRVSAFYARIKDVYEVDHVTTSSRSSHRDDLASLELRQRLLHELINLYAGYTNLNGDSRDLRLRMAYASASGRTGAAVNYRRLFSTQKALSTELDPYYGVMRSYEPYHELAFSAWHDLTANLGAEAGYSVRRLDAGSDVGPFNHEFERYFIAGTVKDWPWTGSALSVTGSGYDTGSDDLWEVEGSFRQRVGESLMLEVGSGYALYDEDRFTFEERNNVRTVFVRGEYDILEDCSLRSRYTIEDDDAGTTHVLEVGVRCRF